MGEQWMKWAIFEGMTKSSARILMKFGGLSSASFVGSLTWTLVVGIVQTFGGIVGSYLRGEKLLVSVRQILSGMVFGVIASVMTVLGVSAFLYEGADAGVITFIVTMSIIPGAFLDWIFFAHPLNIRQWFGVILYLFAGYAVLNFPGLDKLLNLPPWVWCAAGIALLGAFNEAITQSVSKMDPLVNNFWIGLTTIFCGVAGVTLIGGWKFVSLVVPAFWIFALVNGVVVLGMISFKLLAYKGGGSIAIKKLVMQGTHLVGAVILGIIIYAEPLTLGKVLGVAGFFFAFALMDKGTWEYISSRVLNKSAVTL